MRLLAPLGALYGGAMALRARAYRGGLLLRSRLSGPVISVGNLSVGGSGKTPVVARIATLLRDAGLPVAVLSRGYAGAFRGAALVVADGQSVLADAALAGDEPVMLARALAGVVVAVGPRRDVVGRVVESRYGRRVHVLDDGFQHLRLHRDLDLVCLDPRDLEDRPLPAGRLRERPSALARADAIVVWGEALPAALGGAGRVFRARRRVLGFFDLTGAPAAAPRRPFLVSGIARPERFHADARAAVESVAGAFASPDHHRWNAGEWNRLVGTATAAGADAIVTTAKDAVRLPAEPGPLPVLVLGIEAEIEDETRLRERLLAVAGRVRD